MSDTRPWGQAAAGRRPGFGLSAIELLEKAEQYERSTREPTQEGFLQRANIRTTRKGFGHTLSVHQFRTWRKAYGMDYPLVPAIDDQRRPILVYLVDADDGTLLWISANVREVLGAEAWQLVGRPAIEALSRGRDPRQTDPQLCAEYAALRDGTINHSAPPPAYMVHCDGHLIQVKLDAGYGKRSHAWYTQATVLSHVESAADAETRLWADTSGTVYRQMADGTRSSLMPETFNVQPYLIKPPAFTVTREVQGLNIGSSRINGTVINGTLTHTIIRPAAGELERYMAELADLAERQLDGDQ